jgi:DNA polymerase III delta' subunit
MTNVTWKNTVGQERVKDTLAGALENGQVGQAYLFCGDAGMGKFAAALDFGMALLCPDRENAPCMNCTSCSKVKNHAHPDFHIALPVSLEKEHKASDGKLSDDGWDFLHKACLSRIQDPYAITESDGIGEIPVEWIREINHAIVRGSVGSSSNVAIICGVDTMNRSSANAMLKTLEEPPSGAVIILTTDRPHAVLPTIVSRCQMVRFGSCTDSELADALAKRKGLPSDNHGIAAAVRCAEGSLGRALQLMDQPVEELMAQARELLGLLSGGDRMEVARGIDELMENALGHGRNAGAAERILLYVLYTIRDSFLQGIGATEKYIRQADAAAVLNGAFQPGKAGALAQTCQKAISGVRARGNVQLVLVSWALSIMGILNEQ